MTSAPRIMPLFCGLAALACAGLISGAFARPPQGGGSASATDGPPNRVERIRQTNLPNVPLISHLGQSVRFYDDLVKGQVVAINFMYTTCRNSCPVTATHIAHVQQALRERHGDKVRFLSISLNPEFDTPDALSAYANANAAGPNWTFLTGQRADIEQLRRALGAYETDPELDKDPTQHTGVLIIGNEPIGRWKSIAAMVNPVRIRQAVERVLLPVDQWPTGAAMIDEVAYDDRAARR
jgi:protein SCO1